MNTGSEKLALRPGPHTAVGSRISAVPLAVRLSAFAKPTAEPVTILRSRSVADLDLRALRPDIGAPPESPASRPAESLAEPGDPGISTFDQGPRISARSSPGAPPLATRRPDAAEPIVQWRPAAVTRDLPPATADAPIYSRADSPAPPETRAPPPEDEPPVFAAPRSTSPGPTGVQPKILARHDASMPQTPAPKEMLTPPAPRTSVLGSIAAPSYERPLPSPATATGDSTPEAVHDERVAWHRVEQSERPDPRSRPPVVAVAAKPMGTLRATHRDDAPKSRPPPAASVAALSKLREIQRASQGDTVRIGTVQVVVRPTAAPPPMPATPAAPAARAPSAPAGSAFRNVWLSRRRYE